LIDPPATTIDCKFPATPIASGPHSRSHQQTSPVRIDSDLPSESWAGGRLTIGWQASHFETHNCAKGGKFYNRTGLLGLTLRGSRDSRLNRKSNIGNTLRQIAESIRLGIVRFGPIFPVSRGNQGAACQFAWRPGQNVVNSQKKQLRNHQCLARKVNFQVRSPVFVEELRV
jgi:hypothetical protein